MCPEGDSLDKLEVFLTKEIFHTNWYQRRSLKKLTVEALDLDRRFNLEIGLEKFIRPLASLKSVEHFEFIGVFENRHEFGNHPRRPIPRALTHAFLESCKETTLTEFDVHIRCQDNSSAPRFNGHELQVDLEIQEMGRFVSQTEEQDITNIFGAAGIRFNISYFTPAETEAGKDRQGPTSNAKSPW